MEDLDQRIYSIAQKVGLSDDLLNQPCSKDDLQPISKLITNWQDFATYLGLSDLEIEHIRQNRLTTDRPFKSSLEMLTMWRKKCLRNSKSHYLHLLRGCASIADDDELIENICQILANAKRE